MFVRMHVDRIIRAGLRAGLAPDTAAVVEIDDAVCTCKERFDRTDLNARSIRAMITPHHREQSSRIGKRALLDIFDPGAIHADRDLVLGLACDGARVASDTLSVVDDKAEVHKDELNGMILVEFSIGITRGRVLPAKHAKNAKKRLAR
jgi:hypothetical protein